MEGGAMWLFLREIVAFLPSHIRGGVDTEAGAPPALAATPGSDDAGSGDGGEAGDSSMTQSEPPSPAPPHAPLSAAASQSADPVGTGQLKP